MSNNEQSMDLSFFMPGKVGDVEEIKTPISNRFKDDKGKVIPFVFKPITTERVEELEKATTKNIVKKNKVVGTEVDNSRFMARIAVESTVYPDFKAVELRKAYKSEDPVEIARLILHVPGEYSNWIAKAAEINGFDDDVDDLEEIVKN